MLRAGHRAAGCFAGEDDRWLAADGKPRAGRLAVCSQVAAWLPAASAFDWPPRLVRGWQDWDGGIAPGGAPVSQPQEDQPAGDGNQPEAGEAVEQDRGQCLAGPQPGGYQSHSQGKTHQAAPRMVLRSHTPGGVQPEVYGFLLVHYAIRTLMHQAALDAGTDPDRVSFTRTLRLVRRQVTAQAAFSPLTAGPCPDPGPG